MKQFFFHVIGISSTISLLMLLVLLAPAVLSGDYSVVNRFYEQYPGSQPFVIFIMPIILILGSTWIWKMTRRRVQKFPEGLS